MKISLIMTNDVVTVDKDETLAALHEIFKKKEFHHLLVAENNKLLGVISDRDLFKAISPYVGTRVELSRDKTTMNRHAHEIMNDKPITVSEDQMITEAVNLLMGHNISCLPVVSENRHILGIVTMKDIMCANITLRDNV